MKRIISVFLNVKYPFESLLYVIIISLTFTQASLNLCFAVQLLPEYSAEYFAFMNKCVMFSDFSPPPTSQPKPQSVPYQEALSNRRILTSSTESREGLTQQVCVEKPSNLQIYRPFVFVFELISPPSHQSVKICHMRSKSMSKQRTLYHNQLC